MTYRRLVLCLSAAAAVVASMWASPVSADSVQTLDDSQLNALTTTTGGAAPLASENTITHFSGSTFDPNNGVTYGWNMVGVDPASNSSATIQVDVYPVVVNIGGMTFDANNILAGTLASPQFATNSYGKTPAATAAGQFPNRPALIRGAGGTLSQGDARNQLQLEDATMRAQFNRTGSSGYHLRLQPVVQPTITIDVPSGSGVIARSGRGVLFPLVNYSWWGSRIQNLMQSADPTHLPLYLTDSVLLQAGTSCCVIGFHGAGEVVGRGTGSVNGNADQHVQTFAWASWIRPGIYARANGGTDWAVQDIHALSHEIAEWGDDPFVNNKVEPWLTPTAPQYGCTGVMETGDPVVGIGFAIGKNTYDQTPNPNGTVSYDGYYHPEDEALLPWFMRSPSNATGSEPNQSGVGGRYTLMGDLNPFPGFRQAATGC